MNAKKWIHDEYDRIAADFPVTVKWIGENVGPSASRRWLVENSRCDLIMFFDDDHICTPSIQSLFDQIDLYRLDIISGGWLEARYPDHKSVIRKKQHVETVADVLKSRFQVSSRPIGYTYSQSPQLNTDRSVIKTAINLDPTTTELTILVDDCLPTILVRREVFKSVQFDPKFRFFFEWFDFFMQCREQNFRCAATTSTLFWHLPIQYGEVTNRQIYPQHTDLPYFREKWGLHPVFARSSQIIISKDSLSALSPKFL